MLRKDLGNQGEALAAQYLSAKGYQFVTKNYRCSIGEIDLIFKVDEYLVFVEVKTRKGGQVSPLISLTKAKQNRIRKIALWYLSETNETSMQPRFDVVGITMIHGETEIDHIENAF